MKITTFGKSILAILIFSSCSFENNGNQNELANVPTIAKELNIDTTGADLGYLASLNKRKTFKTYDQTLVAYANSNPNRPDSLRKIIYLLPLGDMDVSVENLLKEEAVYLENFFQLKVKLLPRIPFNDLRKIDSVKTRQDPNAYSAYPGKTLGENQQIVEQIEAKSLIDYYIIPNKPKDAVVVLGITDHDIYSRNYNFLFGTSNLKGGSGLVSTHRLKDYPPQTKMNIRKVVSKQIVNLFSIPNVKDFECLLNFHISLSELENGVSYISPVALEKLKINIGFNYDKRFKDLKNFGEATGDLVMANYYSKCLSLGN